MDTSWMKNKQLLFGLSTFVVATVAPLVLGFGWILAVAVGLVFFVIAHTITDEYVGPQFKHIALVVVGLVICIVALVALRNYFLLSLDPGPEMFDILLEERAKVFPYETLMLASTDMSVPERLSSLARIDNMLENLVGAQAELAGAMTREDELHKNVVARTKLEIDAPAEFVEGMTDGYLERANDPAGRELLMRRYEKMSDVYAALEELYRVHRRNFSDYEIVSDNSGELIAVYHSEVVEAAVFDVYDVLFEAEEAYQAAAEDYDAYMDSI